MFILKLNLKFPQMKEPKTYEKEDTIFDLSNTDIFYSLQSHNPTQRNQLISLNFTFSTLWMTDLVDTKLHTCRIPVK